MTDAEEFAHAIAALNRVLLIPSSGLPFDVLERIATHLKLLRTEFVPRLDDELNHMFPLIVVYSECWIDSARGSAFRIGTTGEYEIDEGWMIAVHLPASSLLEFPVPLLEGVLAEEYLHYVWQSLKLLNADQNCKTGEAIDVDVRAPVRYRESLAGYNELDRSFQASAEAWLSPRLQELYSEVNRRGDDVQKALQRIKTNWIDRGLPTGVGPRPSPVTERQWLVDYSLLRANTKS